MGASLIQTGPELGRQICSRPVSDVTPRLIAITGGPGAGKTAVLRMAANVFCQHVAFLPEAATILFSGGFWRRNTSAGLKAAQTAIFHSQRQLEEIFITEKLGAYGLCDRGTVDGFAYWPSECGDFWGDMGTSRQQEISRYFAVIHLRTPNLDLGYDLTSNPVRTETMVEAHAIDARIQEAWSGHPRQHIIPAEEDFQSKAIAVIELLKSLIGEV